MLSKSQKAKVEKALAQHEKFAKCYLWTNRTSASERSRMRRDNNWHVQFKNNGNVYRYDSYLDVSCRNFYYTGRFYLNGEKKNVSLFKKLLNGKAGTVPVSHSGGGGR